MIYKFLSQKGRVFSFYYMFIYCLIKCFLIENLINFMDKIKNNTLPAKKQKQNNTNSLYHRDRSQTGTNP